MATFHMIPTQKAWDAVDKSGCLDNMTVSAYGLLIPKMSYKGLDRLAGVLRSREMTDEQLHDESVKLDKMLEDSKRDEL